MKRILPFLTGLALAASSYAHALGSMAEVSIIDRDSGAILTPYYFRGEYWVAGTPGARYAIEVHNRLGERVLAVTSVDGVNVVTGATASWDQAGYVFGPGEEYRITGWRKSDTAVAAFTFTDASRSYAELTGRPANIGVIGVALFRERPVPTLYSPPLIGQALPRPEAPRAQESAPSASGESQASGESPASGTPMAKAPAARESESARSLAQISPPMSAPKLGTGHGEREYSYVNHTEFARMQSQPNEVIRIRYDSLENLFAMGIIKRPRPAPPGANPFPAAPGGGYVPDPPG